MNAKIKVFDKNPSGQIMTEYERQSKCDPFDRPQVTHQTAIASLERSPAQWKAITHPLLGGSLFECQMGHFMISVHN